MTEHVHRDDAVRALGEIRSRQEQVVAAAAVPDWFWTANGALIVVLAAGVESRRPLLVAVAAGAFCVGLTATLLGVLLRQRARVSARLLHWPVGAAIAGYVLVIVAVGLGTGFGLHVAGFRWPATGGNAVAGVLVAVTGPLFMRRLNRMMMRWAAQRLTAGTR